jgi:non-ribosomal peptide synthase protein (TIGR01720 family)
VRWLPGGDIEFLGRIDSQVKIRGYRIELGEIESVLMQSGLVRQAVVLANEDSQGTKRLVSYVVPEKSFDRQATISYLSGKLPDYMVPALWVELESLPLTPNGKIDRKALPDPDASGLLTNEYIAPRTGLEEKLVLIWQELLGVKQVGINDNFFELGGDSILTIQVVSRVRRLGYELQPKDLFMHHTIAQLSVAIAGRAESLVLGEQGFLTGLAGLLPIQQWYFENEHRALSHFNQSVMLRVEKSVTAEALSAAVKQLLVQHDALRFVYTKTGDWWQQSYGSAAGMLITEDLRSIAQQDLGNTITSYADNYQRSLDIEKGDLVRAVWMQTPDTETSNRLLLVIHHLAVDGVSWRILVEDLELLLQGLMSGVKTETISKSSSYRQWYDALQTYGQGRRLKSQLSYWQQVTESYQAMPVDKGYEGDITVADTFHHSLRLGAAQTQLLLQEVPRVYHTQINDILLSALAITLCKWSNNNKITIGLEGHGREQIAVGIDTSRTVGWFTNLYPLLLTINTSTGNDGLIKSVKEQLRGIPDMGLGYGVLKYINRETTLQGKEPWDIIFNYLGQLDNVVRETSQLSAAAELAGAGRSKEHVLGEKLALNSLIQDGQLVLNWSYSSRHYEEQTIEQLSKEYVSALEDLIAHCITQQQSGTVYTPSDYGLDSVVGYEELDAFLNEPFNGRPRKESIDGLYRLSGLQQGMLFHSLYNGIGGAYIEQFSCDLREVNIDLVIRSWHKLIQQHSILRSAFYYDVFSVPTQCVYKEVQLPVVILDYRNLNKAEQETALLEYREADRARGFDFKSLPLMRVAMIRLDEDCYRMLWTSHHILFDGWSMPILIEEFLNGYESLLSGIEATVKKEEDRFEDYIRYIENQDKEQEEIYWRSYLNGIEQSTLLPFIGTTADRTKGLGIYKSSTLQIDIATTAKVQSYAHSQHLTVNTIMQGVWSCLLHRYTGSNDIMYGVIVSGRPDNLPGVEHRVGMYINTLPLRSTLSTIKI